MAEQVDHEKLLVELSKQENRIKVLRNTIEMRIRGLQIAGPSPAIPYVIEAFQEVLGYIDSFWPEDSNEEAAEEE